MLSTVVSYGLDGESVPLGRSMLVASIHATNSEVGLSRNYLQYLVLGYSQL